MADLFDNIGPRVRLDRDSDRERPCHDNVVVIRPAATMHAGELRCERCDAHRGWASKALIDFVNYTARRFGAPSEPIIWRQQQQERAMAFDNTNRGAIFRDDNKVKETDRDYSGSLNVGGVDHWVSGWVKISKNGKKYLSLSVKPKNEKPAAGTKPPAEDLDDRINF
jgi:hypothetical protein